MRCPDCPTHVFITNCVFVENEARAGMGGALKTSRKARIENCTIANNITSSSNGGGGIFVAHSAHVELLNTILYGNTSASGPSTLEKQILAAADTTGSCIFGSSWNATNCDIEGCGGTSPCATADGNFNRDPKFISPSASPPNLRLKNHSPCIDTGDDSNLPGDRGDVDDDASVAEDLPWDRDAGARKFDAITCNADDVDMGAYELQIYCVGDLDGDNDVDGTDLANLTAQWTGSNTYSPCTPRRPSDLDCDCKVNGTDQTLLLAEWGTCGGESFGGGDELLEWALEASEEELLAWYQLMLEEGFEPEPW
jgi:hypothetical protein